MRSIEHEWLKRQLWGCTFDDFLNPPGWGVIESRKSVSLVSQFSANIKLNLPIVSANMDTITGARMAIAVAKEGGIGIIHRYLTVEEQCSKVQEVKREENFIIDEPYSILQDSTITEARTIMEKNKVGGLVVLKDDNKLAGILTNRDIKYCLGNEKVKSRMIPRNKLITARISEISISLAKKLIDENRLEKLPLVDEDNRIKGLITSIDIDNLEKYPLANKDSNGQLIVGAAIGATGDYIERAAELSKAGADVIVLDIANAQSVVGEKAVLEIRKNLPDIELVIGNIVLARAVERYEKNGVGGLKVGLGPGSACTTRYNTNIGVPQAQAVYECSVASKIPVIADGGIKRDGHIGLALLLGASSVMIGGLLAGTDETPGLVFRNSKGQKVKSFRGMASREAMYDKYKSEQADDPYETTSRISPEGIEKQVEYRGSATPILHDIAGHLASMVSYMGAKSLMEAKEMFMNHPMEYLIKLSESAKKESWDR